MAKRFLLLVCLMLCGCQKHVKTTIPSNCMKIRVTDFTQPCDTLKDGDLMCDRVRVHINCVAAKL